MYCSRKERNESGGVDDVVTMLDACLMQIWADATRRDLSKPQCHLECLKRCALVLEELEIVNDPGEGSAKVRILKLDKNVLWRHLGVVCRIKGCLHTVAVGASLWRVLPQQHSFPSLTALWLQGQGLGPRPARTPAFRARPAGSTTV